MPPKDSWQEFATSATRQASNIHLASVRHKMHEVHRRIRERYPMIARIAVALFEPETRRLRTFIASNENASAPIDGYECALDESPSLQALASGGVVRIINGSETQTPSDSARAHWLDHEAYLSSLTLAIRHNDQLLGFLFFDSIDRNAFTEEIASDLLLSGHLVGMIVSQELATVQILISGIRLASQFAHVRDLETGAHLERMARYARLIAREIGPSHGQPEDYAENIFLFSALHDIGKVGIPDRILLKPGKLDDSERTEMREHVKVGLRMAERMIIDFRLDQLPTIGMLRNIVSAHHERMDGSGYPNGLSGNAIPLEARIVATADVFDALACARSYKPAWALSDAFDEITRMQGAQLYAPAVQALLNCRKEAEAIFERFQEAHVAL